jgi:alpha-amylase/alpha-mannosidase (GH57 family)
MMERYICIHGHFYQPPRENPWLEEVELQDSAYPYHDWNDRITAHCYAPNTASRIFDDDGRIIDIVNNYSKISFNFGPTLLSWMERHRPDVHTAIIEADRLSGQRFSGHGSALAQIYNHMIMPLANKRDKYTQVIWGIKDFQRRFDRDPEGIWLPETAVDIETLEILAELEIQFTILAPRQASRVKKMEKGARWQDVSSGRIDPTMAYMCPLPSGRTIHLFFYDGPISQGIAFEGLLSSGEDFARRLEGAFADFRDWPQIVHIATDGETYGHHHRYGDRALAYCLYFIESRKIAHLTNYGEYLEKHPPTHMVEIFEDSSWSCIHGVERWKENCGCNSGMHSGWHQEWRNPLRQAMDWLRDRSAAIYEEEASGYLRYPWTARTEYIEVIQDRSRENVERFLAEYTSRELSKEEKIKVLKLLEMQRNAMLMYTSCGWFFDEISGIETVQVIQYAARTIQLAEALQPEPIEEEFRKRLEAAPSNPYENGAEIYEMFVKPARIDLLRVGAHYAISSLFEEYPESVQINCYTANSEIYNKVEAGRSQLAIGKTHITSDLTWDEETISFAVLHLGDHNINGGVRGFVSEERFSIMEEEMRAAFDRGSISDVILLINKHFETHTYSVWHLFKDQQRKIIDQVLKLTYESIESSYRQIYENNYIVMNFLQSLDAPLPRPLAVATEHITNIDLQRALQEEELDLEKLGNLIHDVKRWSLKVDTDTLGFVAGSRINALMNQLDREPDDISLLETIDSLLGLLEPLPIDLKLWEAQNMYFSIGKALHSTMREMANNGDDSAPKWIELFHNLGLRLQVKVS